MWMAAAAAGVIALALGRVTIAPSIAQEPEPAKTLIPGKGSDLTTARCATCHDAQHITRAPLSRGEWEFNIKNMIERGAPMAPARFRSSSSTSPPTITATPRCLRRTLPLRVTA